MAPTDRFDMYAVSRMPPSWLARNWQRWQSSWLARNCKMLVLLGTPLVLALIPLIWKSDPPAMSSCLYVTLVMVVYWVTEVVPITITAFIPVVAYPILGVIDAKTIASKYFPDTNFLFLGGLIIAIAREQSNFHRRLSLIILNLLGSDIRSLLAGIMISTAFFSLFVANTATTAMMCPIVLSLCREVIAAKRNHEADKRREVRTTAASIDLQDISGHERKEIVMLLLAICYSASIGGTGSLTGTGPNVIVLHFLDRDYPHQPLSFGTWIMFNILGVIINLIASWFVLQTVILGPASFLKFRRSEEETAGKIAVQEAIKRELVLLGPITWAEGSVIGHFVVVFCLWLLRQPVYGQWFAYATEKHPEGNPKYVSDGTVAMLVALCLFIWPKYKPSYVHQAELAVRGFCNRNQSNVLPATPANQQLEVSPVASNYGNSQTILTWKQAEKAVPWGMIFLVGGGYAMGEGIKVTGISDIIGKTIAELNISNAATCSFCIVLMMFLTEFTSNSATTSIVAPIVLQVAKSGCINPLYLGLPAAVAASYAFMLPVSTPPNAIVFQSGLLKIWDMIRAGFFINLVCLAQLLVAVHVWGEAMFRFSEWPDWAGNCTLTNNQTDGSMI